MSLLFRRHQAYSPGAAPAPAILSAEAGTFVLTGKDATLTPGEASSEWWQNVPLLEWTEIFNSQLTAYLPNNHITATGASLVGSTITWGPNKDGLSNSNVAVTTGLFAERGTYGGMATGSGKVWLRPSDPWWPPTDVHAFNLVTRAWEESVIPSCSRDEWDNTNQVGGLTGNEYHLDGTTPKGCHSYWQQQFIPQRNWFVHFGNQQWYPTDSAGNSNCFVGDLTAGQWLAPGTIGPHPHWDNDALRWIQVHPVTGDVYGLGEDDGNPALKRLWRWNQASNTYTTFSMNLPAVNFITGSIDWDNDEIIFFGGQFSAEFAFVVENLSGTPTFTNLTWGVFSNGRRGGMHYCPDRGKHLGYFDNQILYEFTKTGTVLTIAELMPASAPGAPADQESESNKAGGILNNFQYIPEISGMVLRTSDKKPMRYIRTA